jgi:hypothetical protein
MPNISPHTNPTKLTKHHLGPLYCPHVSPTSLDRLGWAMADAFAGNASAVAWDPVKENGEEDPCKKNPLEVI